MSASTLIQEKLITDFAALKFENGTTNLFNNVKKYYANLVMKGMDCLIIPDSTSETVIGQSAGNTATTRTYGFRAIVVEEIASTDDDSAGSIKYSRLLNIQDSILNYLQKEPSNLNSWGQSQNPVIDVFKIRVQQIIFDRRQSESGYEEYMDIRFNVSVNIVPQLL